jgi:hypothetical protein
MTAEAAHPECTRRSVYEYESSSGGPVLNDERDVTLSITGRQGWVTDIGEGA